MIEFSITLQPDTSLEEAQKIREKLLAVVLDELDKNNQANAIVGSSLTEDEKEVPLTTQIDNVKKIVGGAMMADDGTVVAKITDPDLWDKIKDKGPYSLGD